MGLNHNYWVQLCLCPSHVLSMSGFSTYPEGSLHYGIWYSLLSCLAPSNKTCLIYVSYYSSMLDIRLAISFSLKVYNYLCINMSEPHQWCHANLHCCLTKNQFQETSHVSVCSPHARGLKLNLHKSFYYILAVSITSRFL